MKKSEFIWCWHIHHDVLLEFLTEPFENRVRYIKTFKPEGEHKLRLRLFKKVRGKFPTLNAKLMKADAKWKKAVAEREKAEAKRQKAWDEWEKAHAEWEKAWDKWEKSGAKRQKADAEWFKSSAEWKKKNEKAILALHRKECPNCPWSEEQKTIFPKK